MKMNQNLKIKAIIFDLGNVLVKVDFKRGLLKYRTELKNQNDNHILKILSKDKIYTDFTSGNISAKEVYEKVRLKHNYPFDYDQFVEDWCNVFNPMEGMADLVNIVSESYPVGLLSDVDSLHWHYCLENFPFLQIFSKPTLSYLIGAMKPSPICYITAAKQVKQPVSECLFIDDRLSNVNGAKKIGMQAIQFNGLKSLRQSLNLLGVL
jgi:FMN phosphatase YigB (HAD superfamily)